jgi:hypothetical protein
MSDNSHKPDPDPFVGTISELLEMLQESIASWDEAA